MTTEETQDIANVLLGYEQWRKQRFDQVMNRGEDQLSVSAYLDAVANQRAHDAIEAIQILVGEDGFEFTSAQILDRIRAIVGVE